MNEVESGYQFQTRTIVFLLWKKEDLLENQCNNSQWGLKFQAPKEHKCGVKVIIQLQQTLLKPYDHFTQLSEGPQISSCLQTFLKIKYALKRALK